MSKFKFLLGRINLLNKLTNIRIDSSSNNELIKAQKSAITFDFSLHIPDYEIHSESMTIQVIFNEVSLNMPAGKYNILDGIVSHVDIDSESSKIISTISLNRQTDFVAEVTIGIPSKLNLYIDRTPLIEILNSKAIIINPGYSNKTSSPTGLYQHIPMMAIAKKLNYLLALSGASSQLLWENDPANKIVENFESGMFIDIFTEVSLCRESGFKVYYSDSSEISKALAKCISQCMSEKLQLDNLGIHPKSYLHANKNIIPVCVVPAIENSRLDDAHLRDVDYRNKTAQAIFNGLLKFYSKS